MKRKPKDTFGCHKYPDGETYEAYLMVNSKKVYLGLFPSLKLAQRARKGAQRALEAAAATWK